MKVAALFAAAALTGGGSGAVVYAATARDATTTTSTASATPVADTTGSALTAAEIYAKDARSVVEITVTSSAAVRGPFGGTQTVESAGTGFVYDTDGDIVTNQHVVDGASSITVKLADGSTYDATVVGTDASTDVAVIRIDAPASALHPFTLADSSAVEVGDGVVAIGNPYGLENSVTTGIVSGVGREIEAPDGSKITGAIQTDAAINHGNSGGPLLDLQGRVIGITSQIESESGGNDGIGFAVPANTVKSVVARLLGDTKL
jgi:S1-C subfamily serine protease